MRNPRHFQGVRRNFSAPVPSQVLQEAVEEIRPPSTHRDVIRHNAIVGVTCHPSGLHDALDLSAFHLLVRSYGLICQCSGLYRQIHCSHEFLQGDGGIA